MLALPHARPRFSHLFLPAGCLRSRIIPGPIFLALILAFSFVPCGAASSPSPGPSAELARIVAPLVSGHPGMTGAYVLEKGEESLLARAWLADHAASGIDVQYFIWSTDNIGRLAAEALLRAAERGVQVRVLVDDLLVDASADGLLALAVHPLIDIRIYNPLHSVGTSKAARVANLITDFRGANQRMHDKTFMVDGQVAITGGRNMADEYFDFNQHYNFRDRDILLLGPAVGDMEASFQRFWQSPLSVPVEVLLSKELKEMTPAVAARVYAELHAYAGKPENFAPEVRRALEDLPQKFSALLDALTWDRVRFLSDLPGKNDGSQGLGGGGRTTSALLEVARGARRQVTIQSPYLVMPEGGLDLFRELIARGVKVRISTNSLASTDNLQAFSGYLKQRKELLAAGIEIHEFRPDPRIMRELIARHGKFEKEAPVFAIHAKTLVVDGQTLFVGTFNLDPRSANLNTEVGVLVDDPEIAREVEEHIEQDMRPENSWNAATDDPDGQSGIFKRVRVRFWKMLPIEPLL